MSDRPTIIGVPSIPEPVLSVPIAPAPKPPWWQDRDMIMKIVLLLGAIVTMIQTWHNSNQVADVQQVEKENKKRIGDIHKEVQHQGRMMGHAPVTAEMKD